MKSVLVIGGYGGFGARVSLLLARDGFAVTIAGRDRGKAEAFCRQHPDLPLEALGLDRNQESKPLLEARRPWLVIDAAGPFQGSDYRVARSCIAAACHYVDLADARDFVCGIAELDRDARAAGVCVVSGASSVPALTSAVADRLVAGLDRVTLIDVALSASNRASGSRSVTQAILSYVGKPVRIWRGGGWREAVGWQELERLRFCVPGEKQIRRHVAICDVPDLELLPARYPGHPAVRFRAGSELAVQNVAVWLLSWPVRWGWMRSLRALAGPGLRLQQLLRPLGGDRSAMRVLVKGWIGERAVERHWTVYASSGDGPWIPSLAAPLVARKLAGDAVPAGARSAAGLLALEAFEHMFASFAIRTHREERSTEPLYRRIMGAGFDRLPPAVRGMHMLIGDGAAAGQGSVETGGRAGRLIGRIFGLPAANPNVPVRVWFEETEGVEVWHRSFGSHSFSSRLSESGDLLVERFGPLCFAFSLVGEANALAMHLKRWRFGRLPLPLRLAPRIRGREEERAGRFHFDVEIRLPLIGLLVRYSGWLCPSV